MPSEPVKIFSFSGIDGAGKSTQIEELIQYLEGLGLRVRIFTFWDDVVVLSGLRERMSLSVFRGDRGVGSPDRPIVRRDKNVTSPFVIAFRLMLYGLDALSLSKTAYGAGNNDADVIIFDRYIYDELANLPLKYRLIRFYVRFLLALTPKPDFGFLVDADPEAACARKPEYPLEFVRCNRDAYLRIARVAGMTVLPPSEISQTQLRIRSLVSSLIGAQKDSATLPLECSAPAESAQSTSS